MKKIFATALLALVVAAPASAAFAEGAYVAIDAGQSTLKDSCAGATVSCSESGTAFRIGAGMQISPNFGVEANYAALGSAKASFGSFSAEFKPTALQLEAVFSTPTTNEFSLFGKLGVSRVSSDISGTGVPTTSTTKTAPSYGIGAQYNLSKQVGIRAQYEVVGKANDSVSDYTINMISAGLVFKF